ncbi:MAG: sigma-54-dependent Fis family transcriptional regulator [Planctomycetes bacterium]|nr:sigma-54-dependent Fis family transcriptional regulator [Planctomycetota bacterium]
MSDHKPAILVVDDDAIILDSLGEFLRLEGFDVDQAGDTRSALEKLARGNFKLVISDVNLPDSDGFELLRAIRQKHPEVVTILITGYGTIESAVDAIKLGAYDYLTKPIIDDEVKLAVERALQQQALLAENRTLKDQLAKRTGLEQIVGLDYKMAKIFELIESVADSRVTILLTGDSGTGKSLIARAIHQHGTRRDQPFIEVNCGAIPESLLESELFGHIKGSFTGAIADKDGKFKAADGGTIFLDEISTASPGLQVKLLRVMQERQFEAVGSNETLTTDVRVLLATNVDLQKEVEAGRFRQDLYYRINVITIELPPLAQRQSDIPLLAQHFLNKYNVEFQKRIASIDDAALELLQQHDWPGNIRELENVLARAVVLTKKPTIGVDDLPPNFQQAATLRTGKSYQLQSLQDALEEPEKHIIEAALRANNWNRQATADALKINRTTLYKKMKRYDLNPEALAQS